MSDMLLIMTVKGTNDGGRTHFDMEYIQKATALRVIALAKTVLQYVDRYEDLTDSNREDVACALSAISEFEKDTTNDAR